MVRTKQGGSVLSFVVVGVLLLAIFAGGAYAVRYYRQPAASELPAELPGGEPQEDKSQPQKQTPQPAPDTAKDESSPEKDAPEKTSSQPTRDAPRAPESTEKPHDDEVVLPQTGPSQLLISLFAAGFLSATAIAYLRSRRPGLSL